MRQVVARQQLPCPVLQKQLPYAPILNQTAGQKKKAERFWRTWKGAWKLKKKTKVLWGKTKNTTVGEMQGSIDSSDSSTEKKKPKANGRYILFLLSSLNSCSSASTVFSVQKRHPICHKQVSLVPFPYFCLYH